MKLFGDVLAEQGTDLDFNSLQRVIKAPVIKPQFRLSVLNSDETISYTIPNEDIPEGGLSYTEEYQNGQRRNLDVTLINQDGKYTPSINGIWLSSKFRFDIGLKVKDEIIWFPRGIYVISDMSLQHGVSDKTISMQLCDKFGLFESNLATLQEGYEIEVDSDIVQAVNGILNFTTGSGFIMDYKKPIFDPSFIGKKTQSTIRIEQGGHLSEVIDALATQLSAEYYYNNVGNLCFYPINETVDDSSKPIIWTFDKINSDLSQLSLAYKNTEVINVVKVVGDNITSGVSYAIVSNENPASPICIERIGKRTGEIIQNSNIWSHDLAEDLARYTLRKSSFLGVDFSCTVPFNPILTVNNICEVENDFINLKREKLLITSISYGSSDGVMSLKLCNTQNLPFV